MLRNFVYLNESALESYISTLEDGARQESAHGNSRTSGVGGRAGLSSLGVEASRGGGANDERTLRDTPAARYERLESYCRTNSEQTAWVEVLDPVNDLHGVGIGAMIDLECDLYIPATIKMLSPRGGMADAIKMMEDVMPAAKQLGVDMSGLPQHPRELRAMRTFVEAMATDTVVVGELPEGAPAMAARLERAWLHGDVEGVGRMVAKVSSVLKDGTSKPLVVLGRDVGDSSGLVKRENLLA